MATEVEVPQKVYCCGDNSNDLMAAAMMNGGFGGNMMWNNPFAYMMMMYMMRWMNNGCGEGNYAENANSRAIATLQDTINQNQLNTTVLNALSNNQSAIRDLAQTFSCDINTIQQGVCAINASLQQVAGQLGLGIESVKNAVAMGDNGIIRQLCDNCSGIKSDLCAGFNSTQRTMLEGFNTTQRELLNGSYQTQLATERQTATLGSKLDTNHAADQLQQYQGTSQIVSRIDALSGSMQSAAAQLGFQNERNTSAILQNNTEQTQRILNAINDQSIQSLRDVLATRERELQTQTIINQIKKECGLCC